MEVDKAGHQRKLGGRDLQVSEAFVVHPLEQIGGFPQHEPRAVFGLPELGV
jgi:hypothetical protein